MTSAPSLRLVTSAVERHEQAALVADAARAPSAHNVQPARWRFLGDTRVLLLADPARVLPACDPAGHDIEASLGAAWEGMRLACSLRGRHLAEPHRTAAALHGCSGSGPHRPVAVGVVGEPGSARSPDPDAALVWSRRAWRGRFAAATPVQHAALHDAVARSRPPVRIAILDERAHVASCARWHDEAGGRVIRQRAVVEELGEWMRFSPSDVRWHRDGLTAEALALGAAERWAARWLLQWPVLRVLSTMGADRLLVSEQAQVASAAALVALVTPVALPSFDVGRHFYRAWLAITRAGLAACPLSALTDDELTQRQLQALLRVDTGERVAAVFRVGPPSDVPAESPRLPTHELIV